MRIWHGLVTVLVVALLMPMVRVGLGSFLVVDTLVLFSLFSVGRLWWPLRRPVRAERETFQQTLRRRVLVCMNVVALLIYGTFTIVLLLCTVVVILNAFRVPNVVSFPALFH